MEVRLLDYTSGARKTMALLWVKDGRLQMQGVVPTAIMLDIETVIQRAGSPEAGLALLPKFFSGAYLRAELTR